ncbi:MAG: adenylate kinase [candidate division Zixibacteria bacterium]|nr:adenylate kinase [candidate division Zixibacteria bacterium]
MKNVIFLGPPGSGKGTQAEKLAQEFGLLHLSTGNLLRDDVKKETELGKQAKEYMERGDLVPDDLLVGLIESKLADGEFGNGVILDGFPRTISQAESLKEMLDKKNMIMEAAVLLQVSDEEVVRRLSGRWFCPTCQRVYNYSSNMPKREGICDSDGTKLQRRSDDEESVVHNRLNVYKKQIQPVEDFYRKESILVEVNGNQSPVSVFNDLLKVMKGEKFSLK